MNTLISVREYARLTTEPCENTLDQAQVSVSAFDHLCKLNESFSRTGARLLQVDGRRWLRLDNYVGVLQTPCSTTLEVLPKHHDHGDSLTSCRALLRRMIQSMLDLPTRDAGEANLERFDAPLTEWVMSRFLTELDRILKRGIRFDYQRIEEERPFLRGQLNIFAQLRQPPGRAHHFHVRHDVFVPDRPENRLLKLALERIRLATQHPDNWRLAQEMNFRLAEVPASTRIQDDFRAWGTDSLMVHYQAIKPWCELILNRSLPLALLGTHSGLSLLFPMEKLFEQHVARWLRRQLPTGVRLRAPASSLSLCTHNGKPIFGLKPDLLVEAGTQRWILDTKWKRLNSANRDSKYELSQSDFYQLHAYGMKYLQGRGNMALVYPRTTLFAEPLAPFHFDENLVLSVLPFDLDDDRLLGSDLISLPRHGKSAHGSKEPMADLGAV